MKKVLNTIIDILTIALLVFSVVLVVMAVSSKKTGVPNLFGNAIFSVQTDSMQGTIDQGDMIVCKVAKSGDEYVEGDVVTFQTTVDDVIIYNTHRIIEVEEKNGVRYYTTQGDNSIAPDQKQLTSSDIVAKWNGFRIPGVGKFLNFISTQKGIFICVLMPIILFFLYALYRFVRNLIAYNKEKALEVAKQEKDNIDEEQKQRIIEEYLAKQARQKNDDANNRGEE